jgi:hypothetical protein
MVIMMPFVTSEVMHLSMSICRGEGGAPPGFWHRRPAPPLWFWQDTSAPYQGVGQSDKEKTNVSYDFSPGLDGILTRN